MRVIRAQSAGFCWGVERAIDIAREFAVSGHHPVYTDGPLIHNSQMMERLQNEGIREVGDYQSSSKLAIDGSTEENAKKGYTTVIFGDEKHPEVIGLMGYTEGNGHVVHSIEDIDALPELGDKVVMVSQTTMFTDDFEMLADHLRRKYPGLLVFDTICGATKDRQGDIAVLFDQGVEAFVVIGGHHSANTCKLALLARKTNLPTYHIETVKEIDSAEMSQFRTVGVTAGASTPEFLITSVCEHLASIDHQPSVAGS